MTRKPAKVAADPPQQAGDDWPNLKDLILRLLPPMATLAGVSLAGVSLFQVLDKLNSAATIVDEVLAFCAVILLLCYPITIWAVRTQHGGRALFLARLALAMFMIAVMLLIYAAVRMLLGLGMGK